MTADRTTRRAFLGGALAAGPSWAWAAPAGRKIVTVAGRRVRVIDIHGHCAVPEVEPVVAGTPLAQKVAASNVFGPARIAEMDRRGIDLQVLTVNVYWWYAADQALAERIVAVHDQGLAGLIAAYPGRLAALSSVALQFPELAARQLEHAVRGLGFRGASIGGHVKGESPTSARYDPFWAKCQELDVPVFMHPDNAVSLVRDGALAGGPNLDNIVGNPLETSVFLARMIFDGVLDRFPRLKICAAHGGGFFPSYLGRFEAACAYRPGAVCRNSKPPSAYLKDQILVDSMVFSEEGIRHLVAEMGAGQVVYGSDLPFPWPDTIDTIANARAFTPAQKTAMLGGNLARLLKLPA
ncbi:MAG TPA: amidohydrolase family protein [Caulobacteraceae bacterium]|nr:amidohydrolase family protein [Caulobacteraceae bacterium]